MELNEQMAAHELSKSLEAIHKHALGYKVMSALRKAVHKDDSVKNKTFYVILVVIFFVLLAIISCLIVMIVNAAENADVLSVEDMLVKVMGELTELEVLVEFGNSVNGTLEKILQDMTELSSQTSELDQILNSVSLLVNAEAFALTINVRVVSSCAALHPFSPPGLHWLGSSFSTGRPVYCDKTGTCGQGTGNWVRLTSSQNCFAGFRERTDGNLTATTCVWGMDSAGCGSIVFPTNGTRYSLVCGSITGYQVGSTNAFRNYHENRETGGNFGSSIDSAYVDGVSLTHGTPRQHIWTFAAALDNTGSLDQRSYCPCQSSGDAREPPGFVGADYFCDTGVEDFSDEDGSDLYTTPLWDGMSTCTCCVSMQPPWFYKQLPRATTDDIEMRVCRDEDNTNEDIAVETIEIYIQ